MNEQQKAKALEDLVDALRFYGKTGNWVNTTKYSGDDMEVYSKASTDGGKLARDVLKQFVDTK